MTPANLECPFCAIDPVKLTMPIRDKPVAASPWQNAFAERLMGHCRECVDHLIVLGGASASDPAILCALL